MRGERAGIGFIGLLLQIAEGYFEHTFEAVSEACFGEEEALIEAFEFLHNKIFLCAIVFFCFNGFLLLLLVEQMSGLVAAIAKADADGDGKVTIEEFEAAFGPSSLDERSLMQMMRTGNLGMSLGDVYLFSRRFIESNGLYDKPFQPVVYLESIAAANLEMMVELSPYTWLMMLPALAIFEAIKIMAEVPGDDTRGRIAGTFFAQTEMVCATVFVEVVGVGWTLYNYAKVLALKRMMRPKAATNRSGTLEFASPKIYEDGAIDQYVADNTGLMTITHAMTHATGSHSNAEHEHHRLFGLAGSNGAPLLLRSIKLNAWFMVAGCTFCITTILVPDLTALWHGQQGAAEAFVLGELLLYGMMGLSFALMLLFVTPATFTTFNVVTSVEGFTQDWAIQKGLAAKAADAHTHAHH